MQVRFIRTEKVNGQIFQHGDVADFDLTVCRDLILSGAAILEHSPETRQTAMKNPVRETR